MAKAAIYPSQTQNYISVPLGALVEADKNSGYVYTVSDTSNRPQRHLVTLDRIFNDRVIIISGIKPGMMIITDGAAYLSDQSIIEIVN